mmetsp:Transcript_62690/g.194550  ORF Transcript_62690/g.194550 Transcript_62690/m.194550 type:complete len:233 (+) Transcript_62690:622-1320(+)
MAVVGVGRLRDCLAALPHKVGDESGIVRVALAAGAELLEDFIKHCLSRSPEEVPSAVVHGVALPKGLQLRPCPATVVVAVATTFAVPVAISLTVPIAPPLMVAVPVAVPIAALVVIPGSPSCSLRGSGAWTFLLHEGLLRHRLPKVPHVPRDERGIIGVALTPGAEVADDSVQHRLRRAPEEVPGAVVHGVALPEGLQDPGLARGPVPLPVPFPLPRLTAAAVPLSVAVVAL